MPWETLETHDPNCAEEFLEVMEGDGVVEVRTYCKIPKEGYALSNGHPCQAD